MIGGPEANEASDSKSNIISVYDVFALCKLNQKCLNTTVIDEHSNKSPIQPGGDRDESETK